jgi:GSH-dependent disulfide-bond oxidoreductase
MPQAPIEVFYWPTPNGWKVTIALEEMGLPYVIRPVNIGTGEQFKPEFLAISPNNRMPAIADPEGPDGKPISIFESGAILQYLARKTGQFYGSNPREQAEVEQWLFWQMGGLGPMQGQANVFFRYLPEKIPLAIDRYQGETRRLYEVMNTRLGGVPYLAGEAYSIADIACFPWVFAHFWAGVDLDGLDHLSDWKSRLEQRPAVLTGLGIPPLPDLARLADAGRDMVS